MDFFESILAEPNPDPASPSPADEVFTSGMEVVCKEHHLLSLCRAAFDQYLGVSPRVSAQVQTSLPGIDQCSEVMPHACNLSSGGLRITPKNTEDVTLRLRDIKESAAYNLPTISYLKRELSRSSSRRSSLANFLSASIY